MPQSVIPQDPSQLDPKVVKVMSALKKIESGGDYNAIGDNGESKGAYQWNKNNFENQAKQFGLDPSDFSPANQNKVAYARRKALKDEGRQPEEIAAIWNGAKKTPEGRYTYINPEYGQKFRAALGQTQNQPQGQVSGGSYPTPPEVKPFVPAQETKGQDKGLAQKGLEFLFPVLEQKERTPLQWAGDIGLSALTLTPGLGLAGKGLQAAGLIAKTAKGAEAVAKGGGLLTNLAKGAGIGYGADVASKLSSGETDMGKVATPGLGTALGGGLGIGGTLLSKASAPILSRTSGVPQKALELSAERPGVIKDLIKAGASPKTTRDVAVNAVKTLRKDMSAGWERGVENIVKRYDKVRVGLPENVSAELKDIASRYNTSTKTRINLPQNPASFSAKELTSLVKDINGIKYNPMAPDRALMDMKSYLKGLGKTNFNQAGEFQNLYANYATKSDILDAADDIIKAYKSKNPVSVTTSINRLQTIFNEGKDEYLKAIQALEKETGTDILSHIAANKTASRMPLDLKPGLQLNDLLQWLGVLVTSPRAAAELNRILTGKSEGIIGNLLKTGAKAAPILPGLLQR